jgi:hypothetical protein
VTSQDSSIVCEGAYRNSEMIRQVYFIPFSSEQNNEANTKMYMTIESVKNYLFISEDGSAESLLSTAI